MTAAVLGVDQAAADLDDVVDGSPAEPGLLAFSRA